MRFEAKAGEFAEALGRAALALVDDRVRKIEALSNVHIVAGDDTVRVTVNALDVCITSACTASVTQKGEAAVSAERLAKLAAGFPADATVKVTDENGATLSVRCGRANYKLALLPLAQLPPALKLDKEEGRTELDHETALALVSRLQFCISTEKTRYYLNGIFLHHPDAAHLVGVATDGTRLARLVVPTDAQLSNDRRLIVPLLTIAVLVKLLRRSSAASITLRRLRTLLEIAATDFTVISKLIDGDFPAYERLIPEKPLPNTATLDRAEFAQVLKRMSAVISTDRKMIAAARLAWDPGDTAIKLSLPRQPGAAAEEIDAQVAGRSRVAIALGSLADLVDEIQGDRLTIEVDGLGAVRFTSPDDELMLLQMPLTLGADELEAA